MYLHYYDEELTDTDSRTTMHMHLHDEVTIAEAAGMVAVNSRRTGMYLRGELEGHDYR